MGEATTHSRQIASAAVSLVGAAAVVFGAALPWVQTGRVERSAFTVVRVANDLGVFEKSSQRTAVLSLLVTPAAASLGLMLHSVGRRSLASVCVLFVGLVGAAAGAVATLISSGPKVGPMVSLGGGAVAVIGALVVLATSRTAGRLRSTRTEKSNDE